MNFTDSCVCVVFFQIEIKERKVWYIEIEVEHEGQIVVINPIIQERGRLSIWLKMAE